MSILNTFILFLNQGLMTLFSPIKCDLQLPFCVDNFTQKALIDSELIA